MFEKLQSAFKATAAASNAAETRKDELENAWEQLKEQARNMFCELDLPGEEFKKDNFVMKVSASEVTANVAPSNAFLTWAEDALTDFFEKLEVKYNNLYIS